MAAALLDHQAAGRVRVTSAGSQPANQLNPAEVQAMAEIGLDISHEFPKPLTNDKVQTTDIVITMGCGDACPVYPGKRYLDWDLPDPARALPRSGTAHPRRDRAPCPGLAGRAGRPPGPLTLNLLYGNCVQPHRAEASHNDPICALRLATVCKPLAAHNGGRGYPLKRRSAGQRRSRKRGTGHRIRDLTCAYTRLTWHATPAKWRARTAVILSPFRISPGHDRVLRLRHVADVRFWARLKTQKRSDKGIDAIHVRDIASGAS